MSQTPRRRSLPLPTLRGWWLVAAGLAAGLIVFLALWMGQRSGAPYRPDEQPPAAAAPLFRPLPAPPASGTASTPPPPLPDASGTGDRIEEAPAPLRDDRVAAAPATAPVAAPVELSASSTVPIESPSPRYPTRALRRGESGEVLLRIQVDTRGMPVQVDVASSSGFRELDRAAVSAAQRWRFRPAMRDGMPVAGVVNVPIAFNRTR